MNLSSNELSSNPIMTNLELEISNPCNERCVHCYRICGHTVHGFLSQQDVVHILEEVSLLMNAQCKEILITGGESLLNPEWQEIVAICVQKGFRVTLFTNGTLLDERAANFLAQFTRAQLKEVQFSLYALEGTIHDSITKMKGSHKKTMRAIELLRERQVPVFIACPAMQENKESFPNLMRWADTEGIPSCVDLFIFGTSDYTAQNLSHRLSMDDLEVFFTHTLENDGQLAYIWGSKAPVNPVTTRFYGGACSSLCISGDGTIYPMIGWYTPLGSIRQDSIRDIFLHHPLLKKIRSIMINDIPECKQCDLLSYCSFCPTAHLTAHNGELYKVDANFCTYIRLKKNCIERRDKILGMAQDS